MATFTMELRDVWEATGGKIGLDVYPLFSEDYRDALNSKIKDRFWLREIGAETIDVFQFFMRRKMNEVMPMYNQLYESARLKIDPLSTISIRTVVQNESVAKSVTDTNSDATNSGSTDSKSRAVGSDTPQTRLAGDGDYATSIQDASSVSGSTGTAQETTKAAQEGEQTGNSDTLMTGYQGNQSAMLQAYRDTFLNIDLMILEELESLFMLVWTNGDEFTKTSDSTGLFGGTGGFRPWVF